MDEVLVVAMVVRANGIEAAHVARAAVVAAGGREAGALGSRAVFLLPGASAALDAAVAAMRAAAGAGGPLPRVGIDAGEPPQAAAVAGAEALCDAAEPGEILASEAVRHLAAARAAAPTEPAGAVRVSGAGEPLRAVRLIWRVDEGERRGAAEPAASVIRVVLADDQRLVRSGLRVILDDEPDIRVVAECADGQEAVAAVRARRPDVVLMDIRMPVLDGLGAAGRILADPASETAVVMLTTFDASRYVYEALRIGASGFLLKDAPAERLLDAVRVAAAGDAMISPSITRRLIERFARAARPEDGATPAALAALTAREREVLRLMARGLSNREIAGELVLGENTIKTHVGRVLAKLRARDRVQAVVIAYETDLVAPGG